MPITQEHLARQNPWWENSKNIENDPKISGFEESKIKWVPKIVPEIMQAAPYSLFVLRGPRQVGKTTAIKLMIRGLLKDRKPPSIFFFDCETLYKGNELEAVLEAYFKFKELVNIDSPSFIFLDEITSLPGWSRVLKFLIDQNYFKESVVIISGSNAVDLKKGADRLPGRRGGGREIAFLPLSFKEYLETAHSAFYQQIYKLLPADFSLKIGVLEARSQKLYAHLRSFNRCLQSYLLCGGFPRLINELHKDSFIPYKTYEDYLGWIRGEIAKQKKEEKKAVQILAELSATLGSKLGWDTIAKKLGGLSHHTVEDYVEVSELLFFGKILYQIDLAKKKINWRKNKKFYFIDNLLYFLSRALREKWSDYFNRSVEALSSLQVKSQLVEQTIFNHLLRLSRNFLEPSIVFWSNSSEIDFILWEEKDLLPIEVKWQKSTNKKDFLPMINLHFKKGLLLSQHALERHDNFLILPASIFMSMI